MRWQRCGCTEHAKAAGSLYDDCVDAIRSVNRATIPSPKSQTLQVLHPYRMGAMRRPRSKAKRPPCHHRKRIERRRRNDHLAGDGQDVSQPIGGTKHRHRQKKGLGMPSPSRVGASRRSLSCAPHLPSREDTCLARKTGGLLALLYLAEQLLDGCRHLLASRAGETNHALVVEHVNGRPAAHSPL
jgi:hypothetical protein